MATLYIDRKNAELRLEDKVLVLYAGGERRRSVPLALLDRVTLLCQARLDTRVIGALAEADVALTVANTRRPERHAMMLGPAHKDAGVRLAQYDLFHDERLRLQWGRWLVRQKLRSYQGFFRRALACRADLRRPLWSAQRSLGGLSRDVAAVTDWCTLRGLEGAAARTAFTAYARLMPEALGFEGRRRRPPPDPVNAMLSLTYTLLTTRCQAMLHNVGLDPAIGVLHEPAHGRASLACDQVELWRARADEWVWRLFAERHFKSRDFHYDKGACLLGKSGRQRYYALFEQWAGPIDRALRKQAGVLVRGLRSGRDGLH